MYFSQTFYWWSFHVASKMKKTIIPLVGLGESWYYCPQLLPFETRINSYLEKAFVFVKTWECHLRCQGQIKSSQKCKKSKEVVSFWMHYLTQISSPFSGLLSIFPSCSKVRISIILYILVCKPLKVATCCLDIAFLLFRKFSWMRHFQSSCCRVFFRKRNRSRIVQHISPKFRREVFFQNLLGMWQTKFFIK